MGPIDKGAPIALWPFKEPEVGATKAMQPGLSMNICTVKNAPHPNMAKLFTAWLSTQLPAEVAVNRGHFRPFREGDTSFIAKFYREHGITKAESVPGQGDQGGTYASLDQFLTHVNEAQEKQRKDVYTEAAKIYAGLQK
jgi:ABC-type Fe3+ transport system substrate-binding protein